MSLRGAIRSPLHVAQRCSTLALVGVLLLPVPDTLRPAAAAPAFSRALQQHLRQTVEQALSPDASGAIVGVWDPGHGT